MLFRSDPVLTFATYATMFWEVTFGLLMLNRWTRRVTLTTGVLLHLSLWITLELGVFSWVMLASYIAFVEPEWLSSALKSRKPASLGLRPSTDKF